MEFQVYVSKTELIYDLDPLHVHIELEFHKNVNANVADLGNEGDPPCISINVPVVVAQQFPVGRIVTVRLEDTGEVGKWTCTEKEEKE